MVAAVTVATAVVVWSDPISFFVVPVEPSLFVSLVVSVAVVGEGPGCRVEDQAGEGSPGGDVIGRGQTCRPAKGQEFIRDQWGARRPVQAAAPLTVHAAMSPFIKGRLAASTRPGRCC